MHDVTKQVTIEKTNVNGAVTATITTVNGKVETQVFEGTDAVVQTKIDALK
jgi:K(+)-stimulated pyrophosphate-energized sodium pump